MKTTVTRGGAVPTIDMHDLHLEDRRRLVEDTPEVADPTAMGLETVAEFPDDNFVAADAAQYVVVKSLATGAFDYVADFFKPDAGWRRKILLAVAGAIGTVAEVIANIETIDFHTCRLKFWSTDSACKYSTTSQIVAS